MVKIFLQNRTSFIGKALLRRFTEAEHEIIVPEAKDADYSEALAHAECIVLELTGDSEQATAILSVLKDLELAHDVTLVGISSVMTWNKTAKVQDSQDLAEVQGFVFDAEYTAESSVVPAVRVLETLVTSAQRDKLFSYVIAAGVLFGDEEDELHHLFKTAWLCEAPSLPVIGDGSNIIPTLHVADLASIVSAVVESPPPEQQYIVAVDNSTSSQLSIVEAISAGLGNGGVHHVDPADESVLAGQLGNAEVLLSDFKFDTEPESGSFVAACAIPWVAQHGIAEAFETVRQEFVVARGLRPVRIMFHGPPGSGKSRYAKLTATEHYVPHVAIGDVISEALARDDELAEKLRKSLMDSEAELKSRKKKKAAPLRPKKGAKGPAVIPESDKPRISIELLTRALKRKLRSAPCRNKGFVLDGYPRTLAEATALFGPDPEPAEGEDPEDESDAKRSHSRSHSRNLSLSQSRPPRTAGSSVTGADDDQEDEEEQDEDAEAKSEAKESKAGRVPGIEPEAGTAAEVAPEDEIIRDPTTTVDFVVSLTLSEQAAAARVKALSPDRIIPDHSDEKGFKRRWTFFQLVNDPEAEASLSPLGYLANIDVLELPLEIAQDEKRTLKTIAVYAQKRGKAANYHPTPEEEAARQAVIDDKERAERAAAERTQAALEVAEAADRETKEHATALRKAQVLLEEQQLVEACSLPLRQYLMANVIPALVDGLMDVCKAQPEDPIDYLADYLFKYSVGGALESAPSV